MCVCEYKECTNFWIVKYSYFWLQTHQIKAIHKSLLDVSKVGDHSRGWHEGSFFISYYTEV